MKIGIFIICSLLLSSMISSQPLSIDIKLDKKEYLRYEPITLLIEITNVTDSPVSFRFGFYGDDFKLLVTNNEKKMNNCGLQVGYANYLLGTLENNAIKVYCYPLLPYNCTNSSNANNLMLEHLVEGNYTIELEYNFGKEILNNAENLIVRSNKVEFKVRDTENKIHKEQLKQYIFLMNNFDKYNITTFETKMEDIIILDKQSPYSLLIHEQLMKNFKAKGKYEKYLKKLEKTCFEFPDSYVPLTHALYYKAIINKMANSKELKGTLIQGYSQKVKESRAKIKYERHEKIFLNKGEQK